MLQFVGAFVDWNISDTGRRSDEERGSLRASATNPNKWKGKDEGERREGGKETTDYGGIREKEILTGIWKRED